MKSIGLVLLLSFTGFLLSGCDASYGDRFVRHEVRDFHAAFNEQKYAGLYLTADEQMRRQGSEGNFTNFLASVYQQYGKVVSSKNNAWDTRVNKDRREILLIQDTQFERGSGTETFAYVLVDGKAVLLGYHLTMDDAAGGR